MVTIFPSGLKVKRFQRLPNFDEDIETEYHSYDDVRDIECYRNGYIEVESESQPWSSDS